MEILGSRGGKMCDYSLMSIPNRLAVKGEELVAHRFRTGTIGFASPSDLHGKAVPLEALSNRLSSFLRLRPKPESIPAVCIPPGARLILRNIPERLQRWLAVGPVEEVTFVQLSDSAYTYRDAVRFKDKCEVRLQCLSEGQRVLVLDLSGSERYEPLREHVLGRELPWERQLAAFAWSFGQVESPTMPARRSAGGNF